MPAPPEPVVFSLEDVILNSWVEHAGDYLELEREDEPTEAAPDVISGA